MMTRHAHFRITLIDGDSVMVKNVFWVHLLGQVTLDKPVNLFLALVSHISATYVK